MNKKLYEVDVVFTTKIPVTIAAFNKEDAKHRALELIDNESRDETMARLDAAIRYSPSFEAVEPVVLLEEDYCEDDYAECEACKNVTSCKENGAYHLICGECLHESAIKDDDAVLKTGLTLEEFLNMFRSDVEAICHGMNTNVKFVYSTERGTEIDTEYDGVYESDVNEVTINFRVKGDK